MTDSASQATILVVDDSRTVRAAIAKILGKYYQVVQAGDGEEGWSQLRDNPDIKMVVSDIMMPVLDGYGLICRIRAAGEPRIKDVPIVVITSSEDAITRERAHACGANDFVVKPVESSDLIERANFHTEAKLAGGAQSLTTEEFAEVESTVIEAPDIDTALEIIRGAKDGAVEPYAIDLALEVLPLLEYCNETFEMGLDDPIAEIRERMSTF